MKLIDLTHKIGNNTPPYPGDPETTLRLIKSMGEDGYNLNIFNTSLHTGTHIDMPSHMTADDRPVSAFDPGCFAGRGVMLDVRDQAVICMKKDYEGSIKKGDVVLLYTGFGSRYDTPGVYFGSHPSVDPALAEFLISAEIRMLGMDMPAPDHPPYTAHKLLLSAGIFLLENLTGLERLIGIRDFEVIALPLRIDAEASPVRAVARLT